ncbi:MAG: tetratricopeptide repeat protein [Anaerovoracaceae bacterium]
MKKLRLFIVLALAICLCACGGSSKYDNMSLEELLDLGTKYLQEENYKEAVIVFEQAILIDEKCVDAYIGLADAYIGEENPKKAEEVLTQGYEKTEDSRILSRRFTIKWADEIEALKQQNVASSDMLSLGGKKLQDLSIYDVEKMYQGVGTFSHQVNKGKTTDGRSELYFDYQDGSSGVRFMALDLEDEDYLSIYWETFDWEQITPSQAEQFDGIRPNIDGFFIGDSLEQVCKALKINYEFVSELRKIAVADGGQNFGNISQYIDTANGALLWHSPAMGVGDMHSDSITIIIDNDGLNENVSLYFYGEKLVRIDLSIY